MGSARRISNYEEEVAALHEQLEERTARRDALATQVEELKAQFDEAKAERQSRDVELAEVQRSLRQREREIDEKTAKRVRLQDALSGRVSTKQLLESKRDEIDAELESATVELDEKCKGLDEETAALAELLEKSRAATEDVTAAERAVAMATSTLDDKRKAAQRLEGKIAALEEINRGMLSKNDASAWVAEHGEEFDAAIAPLAAEVRAPQDLEALVEQLLGEDIASMYGARSCFCAKHCGRSFPNGCNRHRIGARRR